MTLKKSDKTVVHQIAHSLGGTTYKYLTKYSKYLVGSYQSQTASANSITLYDVVSGQSKYGASFGVTNGSSNIPALIYGVEGLGILGVGTSKCWWIPASDVEDQSKTAVECVFSGGIYSNGVIDWCFADLGVISGVGRVLLLAEYTNALAARNIWYSTDNDAYHGGSANIGINWQRLNFTSSFSMFTLRHWHGLKWCKGIGPNDGLLLLLAGDNNGQSAILACSDVKSLLDSPDVWAERWGLYGTHTATFTTDYAVNNTTLTLSDATNFNNGDAVWLHSSSNTGEPSGTGLPTGLYGYTTYYIINKAGNTIQLSAERGGTTPVTFSSNGSGTLSIYKTMRSTWAENATAGGTPDSSYVKGWGKQRWRAVGGAYDAARARFYWIPDGREFVDDPVWTKNCAGYVDLLSDSPTFTQIADWGDIKGNGWTGCETENGSLILSNGVLIPAYSTYGGIMPPNEDETVKLFAVSGDGENLVLLREFPKRYSDISQGKWPSSSTPHNIIPLLSIGNSYVGWTNTLHSGVAPSGYRVDSPSTGTVKTYRNLLVGMEDFTNRGSYAESYGIVSITDYHDTVPNTVKVTRNTSAYPYITDNFWVTITGIQNYNGSYQVTRVGTSTTEFYFTPSFERGDGYPMETTGSFSIDPLPQAVRFLSAPSKYVRYTESSFVPKTKLYQPTKSIKFEVNSPTDLNLTYKTGLLPNLDNDFIRRMRGKVLSVVGWAYFDTTNGFEDADCKIFMQFNSTRQASAWSSTETYNTGDKVYYGSGENRAVYIANEDGITGEANSPTNAPSKWTWKGKLTNSYINSFSRHYSGTDNFYANRWIPIHISAHLHDDAIGIEQASFYTNIAIYPLFSTAIRKGVVYISGLRLMEGMISDEEMIDDLISDGGSSGLFGGSGVFGQPNR